MDKNEPQQIVIKDNDIPLFIQYIIYGELMKMRSILLDKIQNLGNQNDISDLHNQIDVLDDFIPIFSDGTIFLTICSGSLSL